MESSEGSTMVPEPTHNLNCLEFGAPRASEPAIFACPYHGRDRHTERGGMFLPQSSNMLAAEALQPCPLCAAYRPSKRANVQASLTAPQVSGRRDVSCAAAPAAPASSTAEIEEDLWQFPDRQNWYKAKFVADDAPDFQPATLVSTRQATAQVREVTLDIEISRERIPLRNAYRHIGQTARVRLASGLDYDVPVASPPFPLTLNRLPLFLSRLDIYAGEIKTQKPEPTSVRATLSLLVPAGKRYEELYNLQEGSALEIGPFQGGGMPLRGPVRSIYSVPTIVIFCEGLGIATARALIEAEPSVGSLNFPLRQSVRLYYRAPNREAFLYQDRFAEWKEQGGCTVVTSTRETFTEMFDNDDTLEYEPAATVAIVLTGQDEEAEDAALEACKEAEITEIVRGTEDDARTEMLEKGK